MNPSDFPDTLSPEEMRRREEGKPIPDDLPLVGGEDYAGEWIRDPKTLDKDEGLDLMWKLAHRKAANYSANYRTTLQAKEVCCMLHYSISRRTALRWMDALAEREDDAYYPHPDTEENVLLLDHQRDNRAPGERE